MYPRKRQAQPSCGERPHVAAVSVSDGVRAQLHALDNPKVQNHPSEVCAAYCGQNKQTSVQRQAMLSWQTRNQRSHDVLDFTERRIKVYQWHAGELICTQLEMSL